MISPCGRRGKGTGAGVPAVPRPPGTLDPRRPCRSRPLDRVHMGCRRWFCLANVPAPRHEEHVHDGLRTALGCVALVAFQKPSLDQAVEEAVGDPDDIAISRRSE
jgi:hypothetical protein